MKDEQTASVGDAQRTHICLHTCLHTYLYTRLYACLCACLYTCICVHMRIHMRIHLLATLGGRTLQSTSRLTWSAPPTMIAITPNSNGLRSWLQALTWCSVRANSGQAGVELPPSDWDRPDRESPHSCSLSAMNSGQEPTTPNGCEQGPQPATSLDRCNACFSAEFSCSRRASLSSQESGFTPTVSLEALESAPRS